MASQDSKLEELCSNTIRVLAAEMVQKANSGHPGMPMGMAPAAHVLWKKIMKYSPENPKWVARDRFVLSNGHGCALQYVMLHLTGYALTMQDLQNFRQLHSKTPGHPEAGAHGTVGVEVTTGPLGQGFANGVGLAIAEAHLAATYNKPEFNLIDNYTYVFCGDGCLQEGVTGEAASLAGHLGLNKLIVIYDDNKISIDGETSLSFTEDVPLRFQGYGWNTITVSNGDSDLKSIEAAIASAKQEKKRPTIISLKTIIGFGAKKQGSEEVHGSPLGKDEIANVKTRFGFAADKSFFVAPEVSEYFGAKKAEGKALEGKWNQLFQGYAAKYPKEAAELKRRVSGELPAGWKAGLPKYDEKSKADATRNLSGIVLNALAEVLPEIMGGSADLTPSNKTNLKKFPVDFQKATPAGRYIRFGVREHAMAAIGNGLNAFGGIIPYTATFLNFIEYCFPAVRLSALTGHQQLFIMTHDSIGLGEDGPTHQPVEALTICRATPNVLTFRPADGKETVGSYISAIEHKNGPSVLALTRQNLPHLPGSSVELVAKGGYAVVDVKEPTLIFVATGSEVSIAIEAAAILTKQGERVRIVSLPCSELFDAQPASYRRSVITPGVPTVSVEALSVFGWERYSHHQIGMRSFGASAPFEKLYDHFGLTPAKVAANAGKFLVQLKEQSKQLGLPALFPLPTHFEFLPSNL